MNEKQEQLVKKFETAMDKLYGNLSTAEKSGIIRGLGFKGSKYKFCFLEMKVFNHDEVYDPCGGGAGWAVGITFKAMKNWLDDKE